MQVDPRRTQRQDTFDLRDQIRADDHMDVQAHADAATGHYEDEEHSILEDDSEAEDGEEMIDDDDMSSQLSIPNESIDFDMVYALHSFAATVEGQANVVKGDSLYLMDDSNSYWWLVRVLKTQEVGYIPAENIETPFERLARLNKHRNVDLALATQEELKEGALMERNIGKPKAPVPHNRTGSRSNQRKSVVWNHNKYFCRYIPPLREGEVEEEDDEWEEDMYEEPDEDLLGDPANSHSMDEDEIVIGMESDGMQWDDSLVDEVQLITPPSQRQQQIQQQQQQQQQQQGIHPTQVGGVPDALQPGSLRAQQAQQMLRAQQQQQQEAMLAQQQQQQGGSQGPAQQGGLQQQAGPRPQDNPGPAGQPVRRIDPAEVVETRKMTVTPTIAREDDGRPATQPYLPSAVLDEERSKRAREEDYSSDEAKKKAKGPQKMAAPVSSASYNKQPPAKLRKEPSRSDTEDEGKEKKKKPSVFSNLFKSKKDKGKDRNVSVGSVDSSEYTGRTSEESSRSGHRPPDPAQSPTTAAAQQQQQALTQKTVSTPPIEQAPSTPERTIPPQVSQTASQLRQRDQQQQALYQQYLNRSPSSPPEAQPSYGLQSASAIMRSPSSNSALGPPTPRPRPGSLILTSPSTDIQANLSVIRVFAGKNLQTEATFKTVLLNPSTTSADLVKQAIQRFRLPTLDDADDYYLIIKQVEGGAFTKLDPAECPLQVFESLVESAEVPRVKRSSVGSISSIASNLSMHPAIKKLSMNDFSDDSAVKIYLNRRRGDSGDDSMSGHEGDDTLTGDISHGEVPDMLPGGKSNYLSVLTSGNVTPERFTSPSIRFPVQVVIYSEDVPEDMQFHPTTEAIVLKSTVDPNAPVMVSPNLRRKIFMFPKNITVAEVTEIGLERFGIQDGVVDGGDEVEDKTTKRRSVIRVRYGLNVAIDGHERELTPSSKVIDAFVKPPSFRPADRQAKRRSLDSSTLLGSVDDIKSDDPVFVLRRATSYRNSTSRRRFSAPLDEIALQHMHRESTSSYNSDAPTPVDENRLKRQEIMAQRAAQRANQEKIVSTQTNSVRGMDVLLPGNVMIRSSRYDVGDKMRYSYVEPDGATYDISDIIEEEWHEMDNHHRDVLEGVMRRDKDGIDKLDRVLSKIRKGKGKEKDFSSLSSTEGRTLSVSNSSVSEYSGDEGEGNNGPASIAEKTQARATPVAASPPEQYSRPGTTTPTGVRALPIPGLNPRRNPAVGSANETSGRGTPLSAPQSNLGRVAEERSRSASKTTQRRLILPKDDFGLSNMMAIIELNASKPKRVEPVLDPVDELLFGTPLDLESLHPAVREIYAPGFRQLEEMDKVLDTYIARSAVGAF